MSVVPLETPRRLRGDSGAALVEAAFITPVFLYLVLGMLEMGLMFRSYLSVNAASQDAARTGSVLGFQGDVDYQIIQVTKRTLNIVPLTEIQRIVVFKATNGPLSVAPLSCRTSSTAAHFTDTTNFCSTYILADLNTTIPSNFYNCSFPGYSAGWCPATRKTAETNAQGNGPPDSIGIYIELKHEYVTHLFGTTKWITSTTIAQLEPESLQ